MSAQLDRVDERRHARLFRQIEALGEPAFPAIVSQMDDLRALKYQQISLVNHATDAFEGMRHYGPERVADALDAILNQLTGQVGSIVSGGSDQKRQQAIAGWRVYAADLACRP